MDLNFEDELMRLWLCCRLSHIWDMLKTLISNSAPTGVITYDLVKSNVRRKFINSSSFSKLDILIVESRGRSHSCGLKNKVDKSKSRRKFTNVACHRCSKKGHIKPYCRLLKKREQRKNKENKTDIDSNEESCH